MDACSDTLETSLQIESKALSGIDSEGNGGVACKIDLYNKHRIGYVAQYFVVGFIIGALPATMYGVFNGYLSVPAYIYSATTNIMLLPWTFKAFFGALNDCLPIRGYRRKPYMAIGWTICATSLVILSLKGLPDPYWCRDADGSYITRCIADMSVSAGPACSHHNVTGPPVAARPCNPAAANEGAFQAALMSLATLGSVMAEVPADGLTITYAKQEPLAQRGYIQTTAYLVRSVGTMCANLLVGFAMNGKEYNGSFSWGLSFPTICGILVVPCVLMIPTSLLFIAEDPVEESHQVRNYVQSVWSLMQSKAFFAIVMFSVFYTGVGGISTNAGVMVSRYWAKVKNMQNQVFSIVGTGLFTVGMAFTRKHLLNVSWRMLIIGTTCLLGVIDAVFVFCTVFDIVRCQYFYLGETVLIEIPSAVQFLVTTFFIVEAADDHNGGLVYGLLTTATNIAKYTSPLASNQIFGLFRPSLSDANNYIDDYASFRVVVARSFLCSYALSFASFVFLPLLPCQKSEAQWRKRAWGHRYHYGVVGIVLLVVLFVYMLSMNVLSIFPQTRCLRLVGGSGC